MFDWFKRLIGRCPHKNGEVKRFITDDGVGVVIRSCFDCSYVKQEIDTDPQNWHCHVLTFHKGKEKAYTPLPNPLLEEEKNTEDQEAKFEVVGEQVEYTHMVSPGIYVVYTDKKPKKQTKRKRKKKPNEVTLIEEEGV